MALSDSLHVVLTKADIGIMLTSYVSGIRLASAFFKDDEDKKELFDLSHRIYKLADKFFAESTTKDDTLHKVVDDNMEAWKELADE